jgi:hypothetical protein
MTEGMLLCGALVIAVMIGFLGLVLISIAVAMHYLS